MTLGIVTIMLCALVLSDLGFLGALMLSIGIFVATHASAFDTFVATTSLETAHVASVSSLTEVVASSFDVYVLMRILIVLAALIVTAHITTRIFSQSLGCSLADSVHISGYAGPSLPGNDASTTTVRALLCISVLYMGLEATPQVVPFFFSAGPSMSAAVAISKTILHSLLIVGAASAAVYLILGITSAVARSRFSQRTTHPVLSSSVVWFSSLLLFSCLLSVLLLTPPERDIVSILGKLLRGS